MAAPREVALNGRGETLMSNDPARPPGVLRKSTFPFRLRRLRLNSVGERNGGVYDRATWQALRRIGFTRRGPTSS
jgi:hypothetical protein